MATIPSMFHDPLTGQGSGSHRYGPSVPTYFDGPPADYVPPKYVPPNGGSVSTQQYIGPDMQPNVGGSDLSPGMGDDPVVTANALLSTGSGVDPQPAIRPRPWYPVPSRAPVMTPLGAPVVYIGNPNFKSVFSEGPAPAAKGGGSPNQPPGSQAHSAAYIIAQDATYGVPTAEEQPWGEDEVSVSGPQSPGAGGPQWSTSGDAILNDVGAIVSGGLNGAEQAAATIAQSHGYDGTTDAYPFSYGQQGYQGARGSLASTNTSGNGGFLILLLVLWVLFK